MENESQEFRKISDRCRELAYWISRNAPECLLEERHLQEGTQERGYWAHGYLSGLMDVMRLFTRGIVDHRYGNGGSSRRAA